MTKTQPSRWGTKTGQATHFLLSSFVCFCKKKTIRFKVHHWITLVLTSRFLNQTCTFYQKSPTQIIYRGWTALNRLPLTTVWCCSHKKCTFCFIQAWASLNILCFIFWVSLQSTLLNGFNMNVRWTKIDISIFSIFFETFIEPLDLILIN